MNLATTRSSLCSYLLVTMTVLTFDVQGCVAIVTGTNKPDGIGRSIVVGLLENGAQKVYATARNIDQLDDLCSKYKDRVVPIALDVTDRAAIAELPTKCPDVNLIVNNAGLLCGVPSVIDIDVESARQEMEINYLAPMAMVKAFAPILKSKTNTAIVNMNSVVGFVNVPEVPTYCASKAATHCLTQSQRRELPNTLVVGVYPGPIDTSMIKKFVMTKYSTNCILNSVLAAFQSGEEDVFPDPFAVEWHELWKKDAKEVERKVGKGVTENNKT